MRYFPYPESLEVRGKHNMAKTSIRTIIVTKMSDKEGGALYLVDSNGVGVSWAKGQKEARHFNAEGDAEGYITDHALDGAFTMFADD